MGKFVARNPVFSPRLLFGPRCEENPLRWAGGRATTHTRERYALYHGMRALGLGEKDAVLVPEYRKRSVNSTPLAGGSGKG
jgi:hypothetical protein